MADAFELLPPPSFAPNPTIESAPSPIQTTATSEEKGALSGGKTYFEKQKEERQKDRAANSNLDYSTIPVARDPEEHASYLQEKSLRDREVELAFKGMEPKRVQVERRDQYGNVLMEAGKPLMKDDVVGVEKKILNEKGEEVTDPDERSFLIKEQGIKLKKEYLLEDAIRVTKDVDIAKKNVDDFLIALYNTPEQRAKLRQEVIEAKKAADPTFISKPDDEEIEEEVDKKVDEKARKYKKTTLQKAIGGVDVSFQVLNANVDAATFIDLVLGNSTADGKYGATPSKDSEANHIDIANLLTYTRDKKAVLSEGFRQTGFEDVIDSWGDTENPRDVNVVINALSSIQAKQGASILFMRSFLITLGYSAEAALLTNETAQTAQNMVGEIVSHFKYSRRVPESVSKQ